MKRFLLAFGFLFVASFGYGWFWDASYSETIKGTGTGAGGATVSISSAASVSNCLTQLVVTSTASTTVRVNAAGETIYAVDVIANVPMILAWEKEFPLCAAPVSSMTIVATGGAPRVQYFGYRLKN